MDTIRSVAAFVLFLTTLAPLSAAAEEQDDWYDIEVIIFKHKAASGEETDVSTRESQVPDYDEAVVLLPPDGVSPQPFAVTSPLAGPRIPYQRLDDSELRMESQVARLTASGEYQPLLHIAWQQPVRSAQPVQWVRLDNRLMQEPSDLQLPPDLLSYKSDDRWPEESPDEDTIEGIIAIERNRFLHINIDLRYLQPDAESGAAGLFSIFTRSEQRPKVFRLHAERRIGIDEVHYFDHPVFGVLVLVTPDEIPEKAPETPGDEPQDS